MRQWRKATKDGKPRVWQKLFQDTGVGQRGQHGKCLKETLQLRLPGKDLGQMTGQSRGPVNAEVLSPWAGLFF